MTLSPIMPAIALGCLALLLAGARVSDAAVTTNAPCDTAQAKSTITEGRYAVVTQGAFLLSEEPTRPRRNPRYHSLLGYLPIGTIVEFAEEEAKIFSRRNDRSETYVKVRSELGLTGLLRQDLFVKFGNRPIVVPTGPDEIPFYREPYPESDKPSDCQDGRTCIRFSRNDDVHLEITDDSHQEYYGVKLYRHRRVRDYRCEEPGWISRERIGVDLKLLDPTADAVRMASWESVPHQDEAIEEIIAKVGDRFDDQGQLLCAVAVKLDADAGMRFLGAGIVIAVDAQLKEQGKFQMIENYEVDNGVDKQRYQLSREILCDRSDPTRMVRLNLENRAGDADRILLNDIDDTKSPWIQTAKGKHSYKKMIVVDSWEAYNQIHATMEEMFEEGDGYLSELEEADQEVMLNFIIEQIAIFQHRKKDFKAIK